MFKYSDLDYDNFYENAQCEKENAEIERILKAFIPECSFVLDLGAGTGLVSSMIGSGCHVLQIEKDVGMKAKNPYPLFVSFDAAEFVKRAKKLGFSYDYTVSLFVLNYMKSGTVTNAAEVSRRGCAFVVYDKPYLEGSASIYAGHKNIFWLKHWLDRILIDREIKKLESKGYIVNTWNLLDESYYKVILISRD